MNQVFALTKLIWFHTMRSRLLVTLGIAAFFLPWGWFELAQTVNIKLQGKVLNLDGEQVLLGGLFITLFISGFLAAAYGMWIMPNLHSGRRGQIVFVLPIRKWLFPLSYAAILVVMLVAQQALMLAALRFSYGTQFWLESGFFFNKYLPCLVLISLAYVGLSFFFGLLAFNFSPMTTFFWGAGTLFFLQGWGILFEIHNTLSMAEYFPSIDKLASVYAFLPPMGDLILDIRKTVRFGGWGYGHFKSMTIWLLVVWSLVAVRLWFPPKNMRQES